MKGVKFEADLHGVAVVGGDSKLGESRALVAVAVGSASSRRRLFLKNGAKPGDIIWSSGLLGSTAAAAWGYKQSQLKRRWKAWAKKTLVTPCLPLARSRRVSEAGIGHGGTDISDGLGADLRTLCNASAVGAMLYADQIPTAPEVREAALIAGTPPWTFALACGGDFQFIVTTSKSCQKRMREFGFCSIGEIRQGHTLKLSLIGGDEIALPTEGHRDHRRLGFVDEISYILRAANLRAST